MIDAADSLSFVLWGVFCLAAGMYPLGFMLGSSCSPCCGDGGDCGDQSVEFNRCIRFVNTNKETPRTQYAYGESVDTPLHGYSRAVTRPEQVGAVRVATTIQISCGAILTTYARNIADGEERKAICRIYYKSPTGRDLGTAVQWTITLRGVNTASDPNRYTPPQFGNNLNGRTATIYSDNAPSDKYSTIISFPSVEVNPVGEQLLSSLALQATNVSGVLSASFGNNSVKTLKRGWIMRAFDNGGGYVFNSQNHPSRNQWNYDTDAVLSFLTGDSTVPYDSGTTIDSPSSTWTMQVSDPTAFCGMPLCQKYINTFFAMYENTIQNTVTVTTAQLPQTTSTQSERGSTTYTNMCYGRDEPKTIPLRLGSDCTYRGTRSTCINYTSAIGYNDGSDNYYINRTGQGDGVPLSPPFSAPIRSFYCGDLLWAIENGPCRSTLSIPSISNGARDTYTLGGDDLANWTNGTPCDLSGVDENNTCHPSEATLTLNEPIRLGRRASGQESAIDAGKIMPGDYVMTLTAFGSLHDTNCNQQVYGFTFPVVSIEDQNLTRYIAYLVRRRELWCADWESAPYKLISYGCFYGMANFDKLNSGWCGVAVGDFAGERPATAISGSAAFGERVAPRSSSVQPQQTSISVKGGNISLTFCCPNRTQSATIPENTSKHLRTWLIESSSTAGAGSTAYITQNGVSGCPFNLIWLSGSKIFSSQWPLTVPFSEAQAFQPSTCPLLAQVTHEEQPGCAWLATTSSDWLIIDRTKDGLLKLTINTDSTAPFLMSNYYTGKKARTGVVAISSGGTTNLWLVAQMQD
jgi:hypothetical protein